MRREGSKGVLRQLRYILDLRATRARSFHEARKTACLRSPDTARARTLHLGHFRCYIDDVPDSGALNLLDELSRRRLVAVLVDQADGEYHRLKLGAEIGEIRRKINDHSGNFIKSLNH